MVGMRSQAGNFEALSLPVVNWRMSKVRTLVSQACDAVVGRLSCNQVSGKIKRRFIAVDLP
jgi:hypothetical protein